LTGAAFFAGALVVTVALTRLVALGAATVFIVVRILLSVERFWLETTGDLSPLARADAIRTRGNSMDA
jgi:hypothetical protein